MVTYDISAIYEELTGEPLGSAIPGISESLILNEFEGYELPRGAEVIYKPNNVLDLEVNYGNIKLGVSADGYIQIDAAVGENEFDLIERNWIKYLDFHKQLSLSSNSLNKFRDLYSDLFNFDVNPRKNSC